jgi:hypothetical protein
MGMRIGFDGGYNRLGVIQVELAKCCRCDHTKMCLVSDSSEGEYAPACICEDCAAILFREEERYEGGKY